MQLTCLLYKHQSALGNFASTRAHWETLAVHHLSRFAHSLWFHQMLHVGQGAKQIAN
jgi:hypothetical protein